MEFGKSQPAASPRVAVAADAARSELEPKHMVWIPGGTFMMGSDRHYPEEAPAHQVRVDGFWMDAYAVTNADFARFVYATGHVTEAERPPDPLNYPGALPELLVPASVVFHKPARPVPLSDPYNWWRYVAGADWRHPTGPDSTIEGLDRHPVVHVTYGDAAAYARWAKKELPSEAEWEFAARGGLDGAEYAWGDELTPNGAYLANTWQGNFPIENLCADGHEWTSPVGSFPPNGYGLYDMIGNVWELTADWYSARHVDHAGCCSANPRGGVREASFDPRMPSIRFGRKVMKGGSFL
ncbi:MAG TPA: formylglycine-generating enzyme family protein, partial [Longimicrobiales bacterium]|nr:formylglycine-generating enzyme family protein [Longimicrobiales bacterium]